MIDFNPIVFRLDLDNWNTSNNKHLAFQATRTVEVREISNQTLILFIDLRLNNRQYLMCENNIGTERLLFFLSFDELSSITYRLS